MPESALFQDGWYRYAARRESPHADARPPETAIDLLVIHSISLPPRRFGGDCVDRLFLGTLDTGVDPSLAELEGLRVSAHFFVRRDGALLQYVSCDRRAWHAGASQFEQRGRCNDFSIGVELEGCDELPFEPSQYETLAALTAALLDAYPIRAVAGHADVAPQRKTDPGPCFDWAELRRATGLPAGFFPFRHG